MLRTDNVALLGSAIDVGGMKRQQALAQSEEAQNVVSTPSMYTLERQPHAVLQCLGCLSVALSPFLGREELEFELSHFWSVYSETLDALS